MPILSKKGLSGILEILLTLGFYLGCGLTLTLYFTLKPILNWYFGEVPEWYFHYIFFFLTISAVFALAIINETRIIFRSVNAQQPFIPRNVTALRRISLFCLLLGILYTIKIFTDFSVFTVIITFIFLLAWLFILVLAEVFQQAVETKQENDLTI